MLRSIRAKLKLRLFIKSWVEYRDLVLGFQAEGPALAEKEEQFLKLKARLAANLQAVEDSVPSVLGAETHREVGAITDMLKRYKNLNERRDWSDTDRDSFERKWHDQYIWLNKLLGAPLQKKPKQKQIKPSVAPVPTGLGKNWLPRRFPVGKPLRLILVLTLFLLAVYVLSWGLGIRQAETGGFTSPEDSRFGGALVSALNALHSVWLFVADFLTPVVATYGLAWTIVLFALLVLSVGYWIYARG